MRGRRPPAAGLSTFLLSFLAAAPPGSPPPLTLSPAAWPLPCFLCFLLLLQEERDGLHSDVADLEAQLETCAADCSGEDTGATGEDEDPTSTTPDFTGEDGGEDAL